MLFRILLLFCVLLTSCKKKTENTTVIIGHAGAGLGVYNGTYPANSKASIDYAMSFVGCGGVEIDVQLSRDSTAWLLHDLQLDAATNAKGCVGDKTDAELTDVHYSTIGKQPLAKLNSIDFAALNVQYLFLDLRHYQFCAEKMVPSATFIHALSTNSFIQTQASKVFIISNQLDWLLQFQGNLGQLFFETEDLDVALSLKDHPAIYGFMLKNKLVNANQVKDLKSSGKKVAIFELRSVKGIQSALRKSPDFVLTDDIRTTLIEK